MTYAYPMPQLGDIIVERDYTIVFVTVDVESSMYTVKVFKGAPAVALRDAKQFRIDAGLPNGEEE